MAVNSGLGKLTGVCVGLAMMGLASGPVSATVVINEVFYDGVGFDAPNVFTELFGTPGFDLTGWTLRGVNGANGTIYNPLDLTGAIIPLDGLLLIVTSTANATLAAIKDFTGQVDWQNGTPDAVQLLDQFDNVVDALQYGPNRDFSTFGEGAAAPDVPAGFSLSRDNFGTDTDDNFTDFTQSTPSPGVGPSLIAIPLPAALPLYGTGLAVMGFLGWRRKRKAAA